MFLLLYFNCLVEMAICISDADVHCFFLQDYWGLIAWGYSEIIDKIYLVIFGKVVLNLIYLIGVLKLLLPAINLVATW